MNLARSFVQYMEANSFGTFGDDLFIGGVPLDAPDTAWWVLLSGGTNESKYATGEKIKDYSINVFYRSMSTSTVYDTLKDFEEFLTNICPTLEDYEVIEISTMVYPTDLDLDNEERTVGMMEVSIRVYSS